MTDLDAMLKIAHALADATGDVLRKYFRTSVHVERKADSSPVSEADRAAEAIMREILARECPSHGIFGEEEARTNPNAPLQWVLDPIDGTKPFLAGYPTFATLICLAESGVPILGIIDQPILRERFVGAHGQKSTLNGKPIRTNTVKKLEEAVLATTSLDYFDAKADAAFAKLRAVARTSVYTGDAYAYAMLASGQISAVLDTGMKPYDFCALVPVVQGASGVITDWHGKPLTIDSPGDVLAAATPELHKIILATLST